MNYRTLNYEHLKDMGINPLTGEACAFGMRILCDLNEDGVQLLNEYYGLIGNGNVWPPRMNSMVGDKPSVASCMISRDMFNNLYKFALFLEGWEKIIHYGDSWLGVTAEHYEQHKDHYAVDAYDVFTNWKSKSQPSVGSRNIHAMSGRAI